MIVHRASTVSIRPPFAADRRLDGTALGLLAYLLSLEDGRQVTARSIGSELKWGEERLRRALKRLIQLGYVEEARRSNCTISAARARRGGRSWLTDSRLEN
jgi:predicted transcriptional regulator